MSKDEIIQKVKEEVELTKEESLFYWVEVMGMEENEALRIWEITSNEDPDILID